MNRKTMIISASILAAGALGTVTVFAATTTSGNGGTSNTTTAHHQKAGAFVFGGADIAKILNVTPQTLKSDLHAGQSLVQIAQNQGISEQTLISDIESAEKTRLDQAVQNDKLTTTQEQNILNKMDTGITNLVEHSGFTLGEKLHGAIKAGGINELTTILGIDKATLQADLKKGESIVDIAQSKGITEQTLVSDLESKLKTKLDAQVQSGKLTSTQEQTISQKFSSHIDTVLNHKGGFNHNKQQSQDSAGNGQTTSTTSA